MRTRTFEVPIDVMNEFAQIVEDNVLTNEIQGVADNGDIIVCIDYERSEKKIIDQIHELIDQYNDDREEEEEEEDEDDEQEDDDDEIDR